MPKPHFMPHRIASVVGDTVADFLIKAFFSIIAMLVPFYGIMGAMTFLAIADFITGVYAASKSKESITAKRFRKTPEKICMYILMVLVGFAFEKFIWDAIPMIKIISVFISLTELKSIFENFNKAFQIDLWKVVKDYIATAAKTFKQ